MPSRRLIQAVKSPEPETFRKRFLEISITVARRQGPELTHQGCPGSGFGALPRKALVRRGVEGGTLGGASLGHGTDDEPAQDRYEARPRGAFSGQVRVLAALRHVEEKRPCPIRGIG